MATSDDDVRIQIDLDTAEASAAVRRLRAELAAMNRDRRLTEFAAEAVPPPTCPTGGVVAISTTDGPWVSACHCQACTYQPLTKRRGGTHDRDQ